MHDPIESIACANRNTIKVFIDEEPHSPHDWDNAGTMLCFHGRYNLGDKSDLNSTDFAGWEEVREYLVKEKDAIVILPLYLFDHSGLTMATSPSIARGIAGKSGSFAFLCKGGCRVGKETLHGESQRNGNEMPRSRGRSLRPVPSRGSVRIHHRG